MALTKRDSALILAVFALVLVLAFGALKGNGKDTPYDELHAGAYRARTAGEAREAVEKGCNECHTLKYLKHHPPKEQCLICHKLVER